MCPFTSSTAHQAAASVGRTHNDNDVFEGLPVKQWGQQPTHVSLAPPKSEDPDNPNDKWADPPMPRDYQLLHPWTQHLLRLARSGKVGTKRKPDPDTDDDKPEDEAPEEVKTHLEDRGYVAKKWKPVPEAMLEPEHKHFEFLAKRRRGLPSLYGPEQVIGAPVVMRKTRVQRANTEGVSFIYQVLIPEGQSIEGELAEDAPEPEGVQLIYPGPGSVIEGLGIANDEGIVVAEHLKPNFASASRRNRPPPKKKGGPGRGKKRVTFTNPDGSTYTTVVPNATKIVPQPGQTVKHVAKGEEATADITAEQAAQRAAKHKGEGEGDEGEGSDDGEDEGDDEDDDGREEGELSDEDDGPTTTANGTPAPSEKKASSVKSGDGTAKTEDAQMEDAPAESQPAAVSPQTRTASSSPELPLARTTHSRQNSTLTPTAHATSLESADVGVGPADEPQADEDGEVVEKFEDGDIDLLGSLEQSLGRGEDGEDGGA